MAADDVMKKVMTIFLLMLVSTSAYSQLHSFIQPLQRIITCLRTIGTPAQSPRSAIAEHNSMSTPLFYMPLIPSII